jgi:hypothetical protein
MVSNLCLASVALFKSGWYFLASLKYAYLISFSEELLFIPSISTLFGYLKIAFTIEVSMS